ncbi:unnamed protein product, partial [Nesidiocoris tenuis]
MAETRGQEEPASGRSIEEQAGVQLFVKGRPEETERDGLKGPTSNGRMCARRFCSCSTEAEAKEVPKGYCP